ncbi:MAG: hypothetical protein PWQ57_1520 [Desulfovibrionales bacterium]|nr:hypothetical protein [Desulfovibrionales bacterium]
MIKRILCVLAFTLLTATAAHADFRLPKNVGDFVLGDDISNYTELVDMGSLTTPANHPYASQVKVKNIPGVKSGYVSFGDCAHPGRIFRIKLKYEDASDKLFHRIMAIYTNAYGMPESWGDVEETFEGWKWSLKDDYGNEVNIILERYLRGEGVEPGVSLRAYIPSYRQAERECWLRHAKDAKKKK